jgi:hypothetical protein
MLPMAGISGSQFHVLKYPAVPATGNGHERGTRGGQNQAMRPCQVAGWSGSAGRRPATKAAGWVQAWLTTKAWLRLELSV